MGLWGGQSIPYAPIAKSLAMYFGNHEDAIIRISNIEVQKEQNILLQAAADLVG